MPDLSITAADAHEYDVTITADDGTETRHRVTVEERWLEQHGVAASQEPILVRAALEQLLEADLTAPLPARFSLADLDGQLPGYPEEILGLL